MAAAESSLQHLVGALDELVSKVDSAGLTETVELLRIARIDLILRAHGFSEAEFDAFLAPIRKRMYGLGSSRALKSPLHRGGRPVARC